MIDLDILVEILPGTDVIMSRVLPFLQFFEIAGIGNSLEESKEALLNDLEHHFFRKFYREEAHLNLYSQGSDGKLIKFEGV